MIKHFSEKRIILPRHQKGGAEMDPELRARLQRDRDHPGSKITAIWRFTGRVLCVIQNRNQTINSAHFQDNLAKS